MLLHHCSNFRAWTSVSLNSRNAQRQGGLSSDSNSSQPSWLHPNDPDTWSPSLSCPDGISSPARHSLNPGSQETGPYVKIGCASWRSCCSPGFWKQLACCWKVLFPESWWTAWLSQAWCAAVGRVFCLCPPEGCWWYSFLCEALISPTKASPSSCNAEHGPYYPTCTENMVLWLQTDPFSTITQNYQTWILLVIKIIISNQNNYRTWHFTPTNFF